jgi:hypothetical protein
LKIKGAQLVRKRSKKLFINFKKILIKKEKLLKAAEE